MGNLRAVFPILISLLIAVGGSFYLYKWISIKTAPDKTVTMEKVDAVPLVVAKVDLPWGTRLTPDMVRTAPFLKESIPAGCFTKTDEVVTRIVLTPLKAGEPVVEHRLAPTTVKTGGVSAVLKEGSRAIAVRGDKVIGISGFINPGNRVDVLVTIKDPEENKEISKTVLNNVLVLASGTQMEENEEGGPSPVDVYTLEVTPEEAERLVLAATKGKLQFSLRNAVDGDTVRTRGVTIPQLLGSLAWAEEKLPKTAPPQKAEAPPAKKPVTVVRKPAPRKIVRKKPERKTFLVAEHIRGVELSKEEFIVKETN